MTEREFTKAKNSAYRLLAMRPRSCSELREKLKDKGFDEGVIGGVLSDLLRLGYVKDREFARQWAASRVRLRGFGRRRIEQELRTKGINPENIREALNGIFGETSEADIARREADRKLKSLGRFDPDVRRRRLAGFLERKGFPSEIIRQTLRECV